MNPTNREVQLRKTCQLYEYVLISLGQEVPEAVAACAVSYDYPVECMKELVSLLESLSGEEFEKVVNNPESQSARDLAQWWQMYQTYIPIEK